MIRRPPRSTLFPTRRSSDLPPSPIRVSGEASSPVHCTTLPLSSFTSQMTSTWGFRQTYSTTVPLRSEEHTSELQSRLHLVCRLLLEKKKNKQRRTLAL